MPGGKYKFKGKVELQLIGQETVNSHNVNIVGVERGKNKSE